MNVTTWALREDLPVIDKVVLVALVVEALNDPTGLAGRHLDVIPRAADTSQEHVDLALDRLKAAGYITPTPRPNSNEAAWRVLFPPTVSLPTKG